jgi:hypothetical protein
MAIITAYKPSALSEHMKKKGGRDEDAATAAEEMTDIN